MIKNPTKLKTFSFFVICFFMLGALSVNADDIRLIPSGKAVGVKLYTDGLLVIGISEVTNFENKTECPAKKSGIRTNDIIEKVNGNAVKNIEDFISTVKNCLCLCHMTWLLSFSFNYISMHKCGQVFRY